MVNDVQGGGWYGYDLWDQELGSDVGDAEGAVGVPTSCRLEDISYVSSVSLGGIMGVVIGGGGIGDGGDVANKGVHS